MLLLVVIVVVAGAVICVWLVGCSVLVLDAVSVIVAFIGVVVGGVGVPVVLVCCCRRRCCRRRWHCCCP